MNLPRIVLLGALAFGILPGRSGAEITLRVQTRAPGATAAVHTNAVIDPSRTAVVIIDMWDRHWCETYTRRVAHLIPRMNAAVAAARSLGMQIVWAPSDVLEAHADSPQRAAMLDVPPAPLPPVIDFNPPPAPVGDLCECGPEPACKPRKAWSRQHPDLEVHSSDVFADCNNGRELLNLCADRGIDTLIYLGVASNMCICYRSCGMVNMRRHGLRTFFVADLVEAITANGRDPVTRQPDPRITPAYGTWRVQQFLEQHISPSFESAQLLAAAGAPRNAAADLPHVVFVIADDEYDSRSTLERFARERLEPHVRCTFLGPAPGDPNSIPGLGVLADADALVLSVRRRFLPVPEMDDLERFIRSGKPLLAVRVSVAAFAEGSGLTRPGPGRVVWQSFDEEILGCRYDGYDPAARRTGSDVWATSARHPILNGLEDLRFHSSAWIYRVTPLAPDTTVLLEGRWSDNVPPQPVAWTRELPDGRRIFYTSLGHPDDFRNPAFLDLLTGAVRWILDEPIPVRTAKAGADAAPRSSAPASFPPPASEDPAPSGFVLAPGLRMTTVLSEPDVAKPVYMTFDERGRLWVVQYLQYPFPAGLKVVDHDEYWRVRYDKFPPPPPPHHVPGADRVTIYHDPDGDGRFEKVRDFVTGLNICTAALPGAGGVWVMNPPYLLFYPDADGDDVPDGDPEVRLEGFGLEDLHAVANSLTWGPDGWLYGCQGSTCTAAIKRPGLDTEPLRFQGQCIWRYHPESRRFELFAEGGYNNFGIAFDREFNLFTGSNGGVIGVHYVQHGYYRKIWGKHGPLTNPHALGWLSEMKDSSSRAKLSQAIILYEGDALPPAYRGRMIAARILQRRIDLCELTPDGSTFAAREVAPIVSTDNPLFRPVDIKIGPDGAVYIADWHEANVTWNVTAGGEDINRAAGRIYRLAAPDRAPYRPFNMARLSHAELVDRLESTNIWERHTALRLLRERRDPTLAPALLNRALSTRGQAALDALWAAAASRPLSPGDALRLIGHPDAPVRRWTIRLLGDDRLRSDTLADRLREIARGEPDPTVRSQLASTARTLPPSIALDVAAGLSAHAEDLDDPHLPLLTWWIVEAAIRSDAEAVLEWLRDAAPWQAPIFSKVITPRLGERFAVEATAQALERCASLLRAAPDSSSTIALVHGMARGLAGKEIPPLPDAFASALAERVGSLQHDPGFLLLALRLGWADAAPAMARAIGASTTPTPVRLQFLRALAEAGSETVIAPAMRMLREDADPELRIGAIEALQRVWIGGGGCGSCPIPALAG